MKEILLFNYWEHIKAEKELSYVYPPENYKRILIHNAAEQILIKIKELNSDQIADNT